MSKKDEALLEICVKCRSNEWGPDTPRKEILNWMHDKAAQALAEQPALEDLGQLPLIDHGGGHYTMGFENPRPSNQYQVQVRAQRTWVGLTDEEIVVTVREAARASAIKRDGSTSERIARAIEAKLKEKNT